MNPLVSIIIPLFNREKLIIHTLDSILKQSYKHWECIVVDDGSTDNSFEAVSTFAKAEPRINIFKRPDYLKKGANACRNYGFLKASGKYINWFDSDDLMMPEKLKLQVRQLESSYLNYSICQTERFDSIENKSLGLRCPQIKSNNILNDYIQFKIFWITGAPLWKKSFLDANNFTFDETLQQSQDYDYHINILAEENQYEIIDLALMKLIKHDTNMSNNKFDTPLKIYSNIKSRCKALTLHNDKLNKNTQIFLFTHLFEFYSKGVAKLGVLPMIKCYFMLTRSFKLFSKSSLNYNQHCLIWILGSVSYKLIGKGERFFKLPKL